jgi:hypothetical protein
MDAPGDAILDAGNRMLAFYEPSLLADPVEINSWTPQGKHNFTPFVSAATAPCACLVDGASLFPI